MCSFLLILNNQNRKNRQSLRCIGKGLIKFQKIGLFVKNVVKVIDVKFSNNCTFYFADSYSL